MVSPEIKQDGFIFACFDPSVAIVAIKKNKPPSHWELDLHNNRGSSILSLFFIIEKPVVVNPETDSKQEFKKLKS